ncbi:MAG: biotin--[acetyl-CoA-carboxylase] ligase [Sphingobacteriaceae bacterium]
MASTNSYLKELLSNSAPAAEGTVILADEQFAGRGQINNSWHSEKGKNLTFSILLNPGFLAIKQQFELNKAISLAVADVLTINLGQGFKIKWPNDILFGSKKIAGILIENIIQGNRWKHAIIGIGLNVNQTHFPPELNKAISIKNILQTDCDLNQLLADLCKAVEVRYLQLKAGKLAALHQDYLNALYKFEENSAFRLNGALKNGKITGISPIGLLQVDLAGEAREFGLKEIEFVID